MCEGGLQMRSKAFVPRDYDVFAGLDVDKRSISVTFTEGAASGLSWCGIN